MINSKSMIQSNNKNIMGLLKRLYKNSKVLELGFENGFNEYIRDNTGAISRN